MATTIVELDNVWMTYSSEVIALRGVSLRLYRGEFAVLLGASGAGKSTLLRCINLLNRPTTGRVIASDLGDLDCPEILREHRKRTGTIFQQHQLIGRRSALQNVLVGRLAYHSTWRSLWLLPKRDRYIALECLDRVGLLEKALAPTKTLSGGQQQRVGIARAFAQHPRLILADEPVASLDPQSAHRVLGLLRQMCREDNVAACASLHQVDLAIAYADRIVGLADGTVVYDDVPERLDRAAIARLYTGEEARSIP